MMFLDGMIRTYIVIVGCMWNHRGSCAEWPVILCDLPPTLPFHPFHHELLGARAGTWQGSDAPGLKAQRLADTTGLWDPLRCRCGACRRGSWLSSGLEASERETQWLIKGWKAGLSYNHRWHSPKASQVVHELGEEKRQSGNYVL